jgi:hypothetical protein
VNLRLVIEVSPTEAAALKRLADKFGHTDAQAYLYAHLPKELRSDQAYDMVRAMAAVEKALEEADVAAWPWVESRELR